MALLEYQHFFLVGLKGVAMTSLAQCLADAGKTISGSDVAEEFVTQPHLDRLDLKVLALSDPIPESTECVVYTSAHGGPDQAQVVAAKNAGLPTFSHAEALAELFNQKKGVAVCGVGGKTTTSAMVAWIFQWLEQHQPSSYPQASFSVGVGNISDLNKTGAWSAESEVFIAEADDYVTDPAAPAKGEEITPRFSYLKPAGIICTNLKYDHPDVYRDFDHTKQVFSQFFAEVKSNGFLVVNGDDQPLVELATSSAQHNQLKLITYGWSEQNHVQVSDYQVLNQTQSAQLTVNDQTSIALTLPFPGRYNLTNAAGAIAAALELGIPAQESIKALREFHSTQRRFEKVGVKNGVTYYDDYAHHPSEVAAAIEAIQAWHPAQRIVVAFQSHTYSRTKQLFDQFVTALAAAPELLMIDIFPSAREKVDPSVSSDSLCQAISEFSPSSQVQNLQTIPRLAEWCRDHLQAGDVCITLGAGDIYHVHDLIQPD